MSKKGNKLAAAPGDELDARSGFAGEPIVSALPKKKWIPRLRAHAIGYARFGLAIQSTDKLLARAVCAGTLLHRTKNSRYADCRDEYFRR